MSTLLFSQGDVPHYHTNQLVRGPDAATRQPVLTTSEFTPQQMSQLFALAEADSGRTGIQASVDDLLLANILAPLASHYHLSEYNQLKHGPRGCEGRYTPLTIQLPAHIKDLRDGQKISAQREAFFSSTDRPRMKLRHPSFTTSTVDYGLRTPLAETPPIPTTAQVFTFSLPSTSKPQTLRSSPPLQPPLSPSLEQALSLAITSPLPTVSSPFSQTIATHTGPSSGPIPPSIVPKTSQSHPINIAAVVPPELIPILASHMTPCASKKPTLFKITWEMSLPVLVVNFQNPTQKSLVPSHLSSSSPKHPAIPISGAALVTQMPPTQTTMMATLAPELVSLPDSPPSTHKLPLEASPAAPSSLPPFGNVLLSSCPGKKVRLGGGAKAGRGAICRDLLTDLARIKSLGVGCIINCLDNDELAFLGAPWESYLGHCGKLGLDVLRLPMPEGLAPLDTAAVDDHLERIIETYTMKGINVLVHCRGGVGRAGLIACCWMLKMGLCGTLAQLDDEGPVPGGHVNQDALLLVESAVRVVRRRRSLKAIETYEQVRFLVEFVEHLRSTVKSPLSSQHHS